MGCCPWLGWFKRKNLKGDKNKKFSHSEPRKDSASKKNVDSHSSGKTNAPNRTPTFSYRELAAATNNFRQESFLGRGGFGAVYKGKLERTGQIVAVKQLDPFGIQGNKEFLVEILMLSLLHHPNLVNMIGYCWEGEHRLLVYEYMPFGSLEDHLFDLTPDRKPIDWRTRMKIAAGAAKGLECLHNANPSVIYRDLKPSNILLDDGFHAKLSDFGLAKFGPADDKSHVSTRVMGTYGYCAPEYALSGRLTTKTDIYSYGIFLLELITGRRAVDEINGRQRHLVQWALPLVKDPKKHFLLADPLLKGEYSVSTMKKALEVVSICLNQNANSRPSSSDLVLAMNYMVSRECEPKGSKNSDVNFIENDHTLTLSPSETTRMLNKEAERDRAVAEAKVWGETWRNKRQQSPQGIPVNKISWVDKIQSS